MRAAQARGPECEAQQCRLQLQRSNREMGAKPGEIQNPGVQQRTTEERMLLKEGEGKELVLSVETRLTSDS